MVPVAGRAGLRRGVRGGRALSEALAPAPRPVGPRRRLPEPGAPRSAECDVSPRCPASWRWKCAASGPRAGPHGGRGAADRGGEWREGRGGTRRGSRSLCPRRGMCSGSPGTGLCPAEAGGSRETCGSLGSLSRRGRTESQAREAAEDGADFCHVQGTPRGLCGGGGGRRGRGTEEGGDPTWVSVGSL